MNRPGEPESAGPVVLLTGAAGGLGRVSATVLLEDGFRVAMVDADSRRLDQAVDAVPEHLRPGATGFTCDLTDDSEVARVVLAVRETFGRIDVLVHNAGVEPAMGFDGADGADRADMDVWDRTFAVNVRAAMVLVTHCTPLWRAQGGGTVVCVGSRSWLSGSSTPGYVASKAALVGLVRSIASQLGPIGVNANVVAPSFLQTPLNDQKMSQGAIEDYARRFLEATPLRRLVEPVDVANAISFLASARARNISGEVLHVAAGTQLAPSVT